MPVLGESRPGLASVGRSRDITPPPRIAAALDRAERASLSVTDLEDTATVRLALAACAATLAGDTSGADLAYHIS